MLQDSDSWLDILQDGLGLARAGEYDRALDYFERARELAPTRAETACALGREHLRRGQTDLALELLELAWQQDRSLVTAGTSLARCLGLDLARFAEAHAVLDDVDARHPREVTSHLIRSEILLAEGRHEEAAVLAEALQGAASERVARSASLLMSRVENERGLCAVKAAGLERAIFAFKRASDLDPLWAAPKSNLGAAFERLGKIQRAETAYREAIQLDSSYGRAWHNLAKLYQRENDPRAREAFERAFRSEPAHPVIAADFALYLAHLGDRDSAEGVLFQHADQLGDLSEAWANLVLPLATGGAAGLARMCLEQARERCTDRELLDRTQALLEKAMPELPAT